MSAAYRFQSRGLTLIEMVTSLVILSILLIACGSILGLATRATGSGATNTQAQLKTADATQQMVDDLNVATNFTERTATAVTFTVPDRLNAGTPQTVRYAWSGTSGASLTRQFNGGTAAAILPGVQSLKLSYLTRTAGPAAVTSSEQLLYSHNAQTGTLGSYQITSSKYGSQYFKQTAVLLGTYSVTRVRIYVKVGSQSDAMNVSIQSAGTLQKPSGTVLSSATVYQSALSTGYEWIDVPVTGVTGISSLTGLCLVLKPESGSTNCGYWQTDAVTLSLNLSEYWSASSNSGSSWSTGSNTTTAWFEVYGTVP